MKGEDLNIGKEKCRPPLRARFFIFHFSFFVLSLAVLCLPASLPGQPSKTIPFLGRLVDSENHRGVPRVAVRVLNAGDGFTDDDGIFQVTLPANATEVQVAAAAGWEILYPVGGRATVPRSASQIVEFIVKPAQSESDLLKREVGRLRKSGRLKDSQIDSLQESLEATAQSFRARESDYQASLDALNQRLQLMADSLESVYLARNRAEIYAAVSADLLAFLDRTKDLRDQLGSVRDVFLRPEAMSQFNGVVDRYSAARNALYDHHEGYLRQVSLFWEEEDLTSRLGQTFDLALTGIHQQIVLPLNQSVIEPMRAYATGRSARMAVQPKAVRSASEAAAALTSRLEELERRIKELLESWPKG